MHPLALAIGYAWIVFWIYWLVSASASKQSVRGGWRTRLTGVSAVGVFVIAGVLRGGGLAVHSVIIAAIGAVLFACGIALAVWARLHLGRNWGMPMTQRAEPELVTSGPYRFVRHPIYSGLLTAMLGALVNGLLGLIVVAVLVAYFYYCGIVKERTLDGRLPHGVPGVQKQDEDAYPLPSCRRAVRRRTQHVTAWVETRSGGLPQLDSVALRVGDPAEPADTLHVLRLAGHVRSLGAQLREHHIQVADPEVEHGLLGARTEVVGPGFEHLDSISRSPGAAR